METELQLLEAIRSGEKQAMRRLYDRYSGYAMAITLRYVPERDDAKDVLQDSFVQILTSVSKFKYHGEGSLKAWVARITANSAIDWLKKSKKLQMTDEFLDEIDENEEMELHGVPPDVLNKMVGRLPIGSRTVLNLFVFEQVPHKEIARQLGISEMASYSRLAHAKRLLRSMITEYLNSQQI